MQPATLAGQFGTDLGPISDCIGFGANRFLPGVAQPFRVYEFLGLLVVLQLKAGFLQVGGPGFFQGAGRHAGHAPAFVERFVSSLGPIFLLGGGDGADGLAAVVHKIQWHTDSKKESRSVAGGGWLIQCGFFLAFGGWRCLGPIWVAPHAHW